MWISSQVRRAAPGGGGADLGVVTVSGREAGVYLNGERRWLPVLGPGGLCWLPQVGEQVLVLKTGADGESPCVVARQQDAPVGLQPGEMELSTRNCSVRLSNGGSIELSGTVFINGVELEEMIRQAAASAGA